MQPNQPMQHLACTCCLCSPCGVLELLHSLSPAHHPDGLDALGLGSSNQHAAEGAACCCDDDVLACLGARHLQQADDCNGVDLWEQPRG